MKKLQGPPPPPLPIEQRLEREIAILRADRKGLVDRITIVDLLIASMEKMLAGEPKSEEAT